MAFHIRHYSNMPFPLIQVYVVLLLMIFQGPINALLQDALTSIDQLEAAAEHAPSLRRRNELHKRALVICSEHGFKQRAAKIHCKQAEYAFKTRNLSGAMEEAEKSIDIYPDHLMVLVIELLR